MQHDVFLRSYIRYRVSSYRAAYNYQVLTQLLVSFLELMTQCKATLMLIMNLSMPDSASKTSLKG